MPEPTYRQIPKVLHTPVGHDIVALNVELGQCFGMEEVAAEVWRLLEAPHTLTGLCAALQAQYDVADEQCRREVGELVADMESAGLVARAP